MSGVAGLIHKGDSRGVSAATDAPPTEVPVKPATKPGSPQHPDVAPSDEPWQLPDPETAPPQPEPDPNRRYETCKWRTEPAGLVMPKLPSLT